MNGGDEATDSGVTTDTAASGDAARDTATSSDGAPIDTAGDAKVDAPGDSAVDSALSTCPAIAPTLGTACVGDVKCPYEPTCPDGTTKVRSATYVCSGGAWTDTTGGPTCVETFDSGASPCPTTEPTAGSACSLYAQECIYGDASKCHSYRCTHIGWVGPTPDCKPGCPATLPTAGASCATAGLTCPGYDDARPDCGSTATCTAAGWKIDPPTATCPHPP